ncbi:hypothetical protein D3C80_689810 [compost metagenome]
MNTKTKRGGMFVQINTCQHCLKEFVANRRYTFCSPLCRYAALTLPQAQEGAISNDQHRNNQENA